MRETPRKNHGPIAAIERDPILTLPEWTALAAHTAALRSPATVVRQNPLRPEKWHLFLPAVGAMNVVLDGEAVGFIEPWVEFDRDGVVLVYANDGENERVAALAAELARALGAEFTRMDILDDENGPVTA